MFCIYPYVAPKFVYSEMAARLRAPFQHLYPPPYFRRGARVLMLASKVPVAIHSRARDRFVTSPLKGGHVILLDFPVSCVTCGLSAFVRPKLRTSI